MPARRCRGFTLLELTVVVAVLGVLIALVAPAVERTRESARRAVCADRLRQIGLALANYETGHRVLPPGYVSNWYAIGGQDSGPGWGWAAQLLPYLERPDVYDLVNFSLDVDAAEVATARHWRVPAFLCPTDRMPELLEARVQQVVVIGGIPQVWSFPLCNLAGANFVGVFGIGEPGVAGEGVFFRNSAIRAADIVDGRTSTLAVGERAHRLNWGRGGATWVGSVVRARLTTCGTPDPDAVGDCFTEDPSGLVLGHTGEGTAPARSTATPTNSSASTATARSSSSATATSGSWPGTWITASTRR